MLSYWQILVKIDNIDRLASIRRAPGNFFELYGSDYPYPDSFRNSGYGVSKSPGVDRHTDTQIHGKHLFGLESMEARGYAPRFKNQRMFHRLLIEVENIVSNDSE